MSEHQEVVKASEVTTTIGTQSAGPTLSQQIEEVFSTQGSLSQQEQTQEEDIVVQASEAVFSAGKDDRLELTLYRKECLKCGLLRPALKDKFFDRASVPCGPEKNDLCPAGYLTIRVTPRWTLKVHALTRKLEAAKDDKMKRLEIITQILQTLQGENPNTAQRLLERLGLQDILG